MATEVTCIVDTDGTQSPDYTSLAAAIAGETGVSPVAVTDHDLVTNDEQLTIECRATSGVADTDAATISGFTTDADNFVKVYVPPAHRHQGAWDDEKYRLSLSARHGVCIKSSDENVHLIGLQLENTSSEAVGSEGAFWVSATGCGINHCICRRTGTTTGGTAINFLNVPSGGTFEAYNNLFIGFGYGFSCNHRYDTVVLSGCLYNNTLINTTLYVRFNTGNGASFSIVNNIVQDPVNHENDYMLNAIGTTACNISGDTSSPDSAFRSISLTFNDAAGGDYALASTDTDAIDTGIGPALDSNVPTTDIVGTSRSGNTCSIGAFEYVVSGGLSIPVAMHHYNLLRSA